ncbi:outer membrane protein [Chitinophaga terrae (ex Kim and Jung 2007)]|jgi:outer membrane protein|uniref:OmpH family outer membrane protein n=1 Tax=Chitinophaga terrae (ex Kim and Jung 2007) TaxID=408074 RepID=UPI00277E65B0|nr:OmpH family outer membrane protein [Chitinophaga terrae (ex Kim and Jung 2007)]MDQ0108626.1 outer membrane protein [Chitinophaga terrae (ex Kim and Jung 2007)]
MKYYYLSGLLSVLSFTAVKAQSKTGYVNFQELILMMPETKVANDSLSILETRLNSDLQDLVKEYTRKVKELDSLGSKLSPVMIETRTSEIRNAEANIQRYKETAAQTLNDKEHALLAPIMDKAKKALKAVANEKGYTLVIDNSKDAVLVSAETDDLMPAVKVKLGLK